MARKAKKPATGKIANGNGATEAPPCFKPSQFLGGPEVFIVADSHGIAYRIDPRSGTFEKLSSR